MPRTKLPKKVNDRRSRRTKQPISTREENDVIKSKRTRFAKSVGGGNYANPPTYCPYRFQIHGIWAVDAVLCKGYCAHERKMDCPKYQTALEREQMYEKKATRESNKLQRREERRKRRLERKETDRQARRKKRTRRRGRRTK